MTFFNTTYIKRFVHKKIVKMVATIPQTPHMGQIWFRASPNINTVRNYLNQRGCVEEIPEGYRGRIIRKIGNEIKQLEACQKAREKHRRQPGEVDMRIANDIVFYKGWQERFSLNGNGTGKTVAGGEKAFLEKEPLFEEHNLFSSKFLLAGMLGISERLFTMLENLGFIGKTESAYNPEDFGRVCQILEFSRKVVCPWNELEVAMHIRQLRISSGILKSKCSDESARAVFRLVNALMRVCGGKAEAVARELLFPKTQTHKARADALGIQRIIENAEKYAEKVAANNRMLMAIGAPPVSESSAAVVPIILGFETGLTARAGAGVSSYNFCQHRGKGPGGPEEA